MCVLFSALCSGNGSTGLSVCVSVCHTQRCALATVQQVCLGVCVNSQPCVLETVQPFFVCLCAYMCVCVFVCDCVPFLALCLVTVQPVCVYVCAVLSPVLW